MNELVAAALAIVTLAAVAFIGIGIIEMSHEAVGNVVTNASILDAFYINIATTFTTLGNMLPIVVLALVGGLAVFYVISYLGRQ